MNDLKILAVQYPVESACSLTQVRSKASKLIEEADRCSADLLMLPELFALDLIPRGSLEQDQKNLEWIAREHVPALLEHLATESRRRGLGILAGSVPAPSHKSGKIRNLSVLFDGHGNSFSQEKIHLTPDERAWGWEGGEELRPFSFRGVYCQILICYDIQFAALSAAFNGKSPELFLCPSMTEAAGLQRVRVGCQARAVEHYAFTVVTGTTQGPTGSYRSRASAFSPYDDHFSGVLTEAAAEENLLISLPFTRLRSCRKQAGIFSARDSRPFTVQERLSTESSQ
jgi:predicted amidohydrolase